MRRRRIRRRKKLHHLRPRQRIRARRPRGPQLRHRNPQRHNSSHRSNRIEHPTEPQHGTITINGSATDTTAGLLTFVVINDEGRQIGEPVSVGRCNHAHLTPCPTRASDLSIPLDIEDLPEGEDQIRVLATNAAHDEATSPPYSLTVANAPSKDPNASGTGSQTTTSATTATTSQQPAIATTTTPPPANATANPRNAPRQHPPIKLVAARLRHGSLVLQGTVPTNATGLLKVTINGYRRDGRRWKAKALTHLAKGRFSASFRVAGRSLRRHATVEILYLGSALFLPTGLRATVGPLTGTTRGYRRT